MPLCLLTPDMQNRRIIDELLRGAGGTPQPTLESNSMIVLFAHVRTGRWASVMPAKLAETLGLTETHPRHPDRRAGGGAHDRAGGPGARADDAADGRAGGGSAAAGEVDRRRGRKRMNRKPATMFTLAELESVMPLVRASVPPTPQYAWPLLKARTGVEVVVKHENHTPIGAFKVRGGLVYLDRLKRERPQVRASSRRRAAITASRWPSPARAPASPCTIVVPHGNSTEKNARHAGASAPS